jgi:putative oxidoreductase
VLGDSEALHAIFSNPDKFAAAAPYVFLVASLIILLAGPGSFSIDGLANKFLWKREAQTKTSS